MPLFQRRRERERRAAEAADGRPRALALRFTPEARAKLVWAAADNVPAVNIDLLRSADAPLLFRQEAAVLVREWGLAPFTADGVPDFLANRATDDQVVDIIEAFFVAAAQVVAVATSQSAPYGGGWQEREALNAAIAAYRSKVNEILDDHDIAWQLVGDEMIPRSSIAMHATIIEPVITLTGGDARFAKRREGVPRGAARAQAGWQSPTRNHSGGDEPAGDVGGGGSEGRHPRPPARRCAKARAARNVRLKVGRGRRFHRGLGKFRPKHSRRRSPRSRCVEG